MYRTHTCNELTDKDIEKEVTLSGWVHRRRDHGGVIFIDLRDRYGLTQIVSDPEKFADAHWLMDKARSEFVLKISGKVRLRPDNQYNKNLETGKIEVLVSDIQILNEASPPPFEIDQEKQVGEDLRLTYRYLDLRKDRLKNNIILRHNIIKDIRDFFDKEGFLEIETPILIKGTPEGSREYIVPSRIYPGNFYVLPQSPQQLKQLLMISGFDKYFQIARCFRDEDQRGDRQPEFTQLDIEMSFVDEKEVMNLNEKIFIELTEKYCPDKRILSKPFPVLTYKEAMDKYGSDSPDIRFDLELDDVSELVKESEFSVFSNAVKNGGVVKTLRVPGGGNFSRKDIDEYTEMAKAMGAKGLAYIIIDDDGPRSSIVKFFKEDELHALIEKTGAVAGDIIFFAADIYSIACASLGRLRLEIAKRLGLIDKNLFAYVWITDFPMFETNGETGKLDAVHHPFTAPKSGADLLSSPETALAKAYDVVLNGTEIGGGSIRIHNSDTQKAVFKTLDISKEEAEYRFGHMLNAFKYGAPPHGGIAWGLDRLIMIFASEPNIREVIAFPKDQKAKDLMLGSPSQIKKDQLTELQIKLDLKE
ncbi:aspartate--tRNA ligase [Candidatus Peregrinibacteria bacterium]|nr:aspartate--tRNA ligase [Candidatus Peregrinibacteria bacterium]